jgi:hypothetical protein
MAIAQEVATVMVHQRSEVDGVMINQQHLLLILLLLYNNKHILVTTSISWLILAAVTELGCWLL